MPSPRVTTTILLCALAVAAVPFANADMAPMKEKPAFKTGWHSSFSQAEAEAKSLGKPLLVHFYADWCGPCQMMERNVLNQPEVVRCLGRDVVGVKVNADRHPELKSRFGVSGFPSDVIVSPTGEATTRYVGATSESGFVARLKKEGGKYPGKGETELAEKAEPKATKKTSKDRRKNDAKHLGLEGYSPVALSTGQIWKKGKSHYSAIYRGIEYRFADERELERFLETPAEYAPKLLGCDPVILSDSGRAVQGQITHGVFFRGDVYLLATDANRKTFLENPAFYADKRFAVEADEIEQYVRR